MCNLVVILLTLPHSPPKLHLSDHLDFFLKDKYILAANYIYRSSWGGGGNWGHQRGLIEFQSEIMQEGIFIKKVSYPK